MTSTAQVNGEQGEKIAQQVLKKAGYRIETVNYRTRRGEIDVVAWHKKVLVFIEVKMRSEKSIDQQGESVTSAKQRKIASAALEYIRAHALHDREVRFDVVLVRSAVETEIISDAFSMPAGMGV